MRHSRIGAGAGVQALRVRAPAVCPYRVTSQAEAEKAVVQVIVETRRLHHRERRELISDEETVQQVERPKGAGGGEREQGRGKAVESIEACC